MENSIQRLHDNLIQFFQTGQTKNLAFRKQGLSTLRKALLAYEPQLEAAILADMNKSHDEFYLTELSIVYDEIAYAENHLKSWAKDKMVGGNILSMPSKSYIHYEPMGTALIIAPWNYPVNLLLCPLIGAIAAGCTAMLKPSPYVPHVSAVLAEMVKQFFAPNYICLIEGNRDVNTTLLAMRWDLIFFTGSPTLGRIVMEAAAKNLTPCVLELGGKSPCIVDKDADIHMAARRIMWGKLLNAGQTCIAPDYLLVHENIKEALFKEMEQVAKEFVPHPLDADQDKNRFVKIVSEKAMQRLSSYLKEGQVIFGGQTDESIRAIEPTLLDVSELIAHGTFPKIMEDEIFGPIFPVISFKDINDITSAEGSLIAQFFMREKPLALYFFGQEENARRIMEGTSSGGMCINDTILHIVNPNLPFGGVGNSGMGRYHRKQSFLVFSNHRSVLHASNPIRIKLKEVPFIHFDWLEQILRKISRSAIE